jgi:hypothetical protein
MTKEQHNLWLSLPETEEVLKIVKDHMTEIAEYMANGQGMDMGSVESTALNYAMKHGEIRGLSFILNTFEFEEERKE